jgi:hypothetical protein
MLDMQLKIAAHPTVRAGGEDDAIRFNHNTSGKKT